MKATRIALVLLLGFLIAAAGQERKLETTTLSVGSATIDEIKGEVTVQPPQGAPMQPQRGQTLAADTVIETHNGSALLHLEDGSQVLVKKKSRVVLKAPTQGSGNFFELLLGKIAAKVQKRIGNAPSFRMGTPTAVVTVRGTQFEVDVDKKGKTYVEVFDGLVEVASLNAPQSPVLVRPGYRTWVTPGSVPEPPETLNNQFNERDRNDREFERPDAPGENNRSTDNPQNSEKPD